MSDNYRLSDDEKLMLQAVFSYSPLPTRAKKQQLATTLGVNENKVANWFKYERRKYKHGKGLNTSSLCKFIVNTVLFTAKLIVVLNPVV